MLVRRVKFIVYIVLGLAVCCSSFLFWDMYKPQSYSMFRYEITRQKDFSLNKTQEPLNPIECSFRDAEDKKLGNVIVSPKAHPVRASYLLKANLSCYKESQKSEDLDRVLDAASDLLALGINQGDALYFGYRFPYKWAPGGTPWVSGMAQGEALSAFVELYVLTGEQKWLDIADQVFETFTLYRRPGRKYAVSHIDEYGFYWIDEYPMFPPRRVLNGFIYGLYGMIDYYHVTKSDIALKHIQAALTTLETYSAFWRSPGRISHYSLMDKSQNEHYHGVHIRQFETLAVVTGDTYFKKFADKLKQDHAP